MTELQQRDRELNTLWNNHQRQSDSVQADRVAVVQLTRALKVREGDLFSRNDEVEALRSKLRLVDEEQADRKMMLSTAQTQLEKLNAQLTSAMTQIREVEVLIPPKLYLYEYRTYTRNVPFATIDTLIIYHFYYINCIICHYINQRISTVLK